MRLDVWARQVSVTGEGAYIMQLSAQNGEETGMKLYDGWQDQSVSCLTDLSQTSNNLVCVGLYDISSTCKVFNSGAFLAGQTTPPPWLALLAAENHQVRMCYARLYSHGQSRRQWHS